MSTSTKIRILDECAQLNVTSAVSYLRSYPLLKITGDNLDVYIRVGLKTVQNSNRDLHLFASNDLSCRVATPDMDRRKPAVQPVTADMLRLINDEKQPVLLHSIGKFVAKLW